MAKKRPTAKELLSLASLARQVHRRATFKVRRGDSIVTLSDLRPDVTAKGNFTSRTVNLKEDGKAKSYDGNYVFDLVDAAVSERK
jgi:hypothetical protein